MDSICGTAISRIVFFLPITSTNEGYIKLPQMSPTGPGKKKITNID